MFMHRIFGWSRVGDRDDFGLVANGLSATGVTHAAANPTFGTYFGSLGSTSRHPHGHKPIVFGDPNSEACLVNRQFHQVRLNLFLLASPNQTRTALSDDSQTVSAVADTRPKEASPTHQETVTNTLWDKNVSQKPAAVIQSTSPSRMDHFGQPLNYPDPCPPFKFGYCARALRQSCVSQLRDKLLLNPPSDWTPSRWVFPSLHGATVSSTHPSL